MKRTKLQRMLAMLLSALLIIGSFGESGLLAFAAEEEDAAEAAEAAGEEEDEEQRMSLAALAEEYGEPDGDGEDLYKIIFVKEESTTLSVKAEKKLEAMGNELIKIGEDGAVTQEFERGAEDILAPLVYLREGYGAPRARTWKVVYSVEKPTPSDTGSGSGGGSYETVTKYFPFDAKVKDVYQQLSGQFSNRTIRLYANWQKAYPLEFDMKGADYPEDVNVTGVYYPDEELTGYVQNDNLVLEMPVDEPDGFSFAGWKYRFGEGAVQEAVPVTETDDEGNTTITGWTIATGHHTEKLTAYPIWDPYHYSISYVGIKVKADVLPEADGAFDEYADGEEVVLDVTELPTSYTAVTSTVLPTAEEINKGVLDPAFSEENVFLCWSKSRKYNKTVRTLGKGGEVKSGDVTLYVIFTSKYPTPKLDADEYAESGFTAQQINEFNLLNKGEYAVVELIGKGMSADVNTVELTEKSAKYFELCTVDDRWAQQGQGYATIGIRLKPEVDFATAQLALKEKKIKLKVLGTTPEMDENEQPVYSEVSLSLKMKLKVPKYKMSTTMGTLYTSLQGEGEDKKPGVFVVREKNGAMDPETVGDEWVADFVTESGKTYTAVPAEDVAVEVDKENNIIVSAYKGIKKSYIRLRNNGWLDGAYQYYSFTIKEITKEPTLELSAKKVTLNKGYEDEEASVTVRYKGGMTLDPSLLSLNTSLLPAGITAELDGDRIIVKGGKDLKPVSYKVSVSCKGVKKPVALSIKVDKTVAEKAAKIKVKGALDAVMGGSLYLTPSVKGFGGTITDIRVKAEEGKVSAFETEWNGSSAELYTNKNYVPTTAKIEIPMEIVMSTGRVLPFTVKTTPKKGIVKLDVYEAALAVPEEGLVDGPVSVSVPVIVTYTYKYYIDANTSCTRVYTADLSTDEGKARFLVGEEQKLLSREGVYTGSYKDGVITITYTGGYPVKQGHYTLKLSGTWATTKKECRKSFQLTIAKQH